MICEFCAQGVVGWQALAIHLVHQCFKEQLMTGTKKLAFKKRRAAGTSHLSVRCWCGVTFSYKPRGKDSNKLSSFAAHLRAQGGVGQHLLKIALLPPDQVNK